MTTSEIESWLVSELARQLRLPNGAVDPTASFNSYGIDSAAVTAIAAALSKRLGVRVAPPIFWRFRSARELAAHLGGSDERSPRTAVKPSQEHRAADADAPYDIAIIGVGCRFPRSDDPNGYWELLRSGGDAISDAPADRWDVDAFFDVDPKQPGKSVTRWGGFVDDALSFDPQAFGISPREAEHMDPQQRVALEVAWRAFEHAGLPFAQLRDASIGVFVGAMWSEYGLAAATRLDEITAHTVTGVDTSIIPARISYAFGLQGPSLAINTACSSSLVAVHLACQSIARGESSMALAGGVSLILSPYSNVAMSKFGAMSPSGRCRAFDAGANGYVRGEGCGFVVLKPLRAALRDGDPIRCVIRGSAVNNDGFSNGLTAPNPRAQETVIEAAVRRAALEPHDVHYVETHGPGTILGDPIEAGALGRTLGAGRASEQPLLIGSAKTNFGHLEAAAGIAGLIKVVLALGHRQVPPNLHFERSNPHILFDELRLRVSTELSPWPEAQGVAVAGVSSFGFGGTNCHVIAQEPQRARLAALPLAASSQAELIESARALERATTARENAVELERLCRSAAWRVGRGSFRKVLRADSATTLAAELRAFATTQSGSDRTTQVVFVCPGQGGQWHGMCRTLIAQEPAFHAKLRECADAIEQQAGWSLWDQLLGTPELARAAIVQPMVFAIQVAFGALLRSWGITPDVLIGHSMGEVAAAHLAGVLSLRDATAIICERSRLASAAPGQGGMAVIGLGAEAAREALTAYVPKLSVAAYNAPTSTVVSGEVEALQELCAELEGQGVYAAQISVDFASHSAQMDSLRAPLMEALAGIRPHTARARMISTVTGELIEGAECGPSYWADNLREPVQLMQVVGGCLERGPAVFVELSPHPVLMQSLAKQIEHAGARAEVLPLMRRDECERLTITRAVGRLFELGVDVAWPRVAGPGEPIGDESNAGAVAPAEAELVLLSLSARSPRALGSLARAYRAHLASGAAQQALEDIAYTANARRAQHRHRIAVVASSAAQVVEALDAFEAGAAQPGLFASHSEEQSAAQVAWLFPDAQAGWDVSRLASLERFEAYAHALERCDRALALHDGWSVRAELASGTIGETRRGATWIAVQIAIAELLRAHGVSPECVAGSGTGELAAAHVAGVLSLEDVARVLNARARLASVVDSVAVCAELARLLSGLVPRKASCRIVSAFDGRTVIGFELDARYWARSLSRPAPDAAVIARALAGEDGATLVDLSPDLRVHGSGASLAGVAGAPNRDALLEALAALHVRGTHVDLRALHPWGGRCVDLPGYRFDRQRYWRAADLTRSAVAQPAAACPVLGQRLDTAAVRSVHQNVLSLGARSVLGDHVVYGKAVVAGAHYVTAMLAAAASELGDARVSLTDVELSRSLAIEPGESFALQTIARDESGELAMSVASRPHGRANGSAAWTAHCRATASRAGELAERPDLSSASARCLERFEKEAFYRDWRQAGYQLGPAFSAIDRLARRDGEVLAELSNPERGRAEQSPLACGLLDSLFQMIAVACPGGALALATIGDVYAPVAIRRIAILQAKVQGPLRARAMLTGQLDDGTLSDRITGDCVLVDGEGRAVMSIEGLALQRAPRAALLREPAVTAQVSHELRWVEAPARVSRNDLRGGLAILALGTDASSAQPLLERAKQRDARAELRLLDLSQPSASYSGAIAALIDQAGSELRDLVVLGPSIAMPRPSEHERAGAGPCAIEESACYALVELARALNRSSNDGLRLHVVTRGAQGPMPGAQSTAPAQAFADAALWGLASVIAIEHSAWQTRRIDVAEGAWVEALWSELLAADEEDQIARRGAQRFARRLRPHAQAPSTARDPLFEAHATQLVTGGLGGIGLKLAQWLVEHGARHLVLAGRSAPSERALQTQRALERRGARVVFRELDVSSAESVAQLVQSIGAELPPLRGVFHAAGLLDDGMLDNITSEQLRRVFAPKVSGAWQLDRATDGLPLRHFVLFSSVASFLGLAGQASYAAANAFMDGLARDRQQRGLPALSINWGPWSEVGLAAAEDKRGDRLAARGLRSMSPDTCFAVLEQALRAGDVERVAMAFEPALWQSSHAHVKRWSLFGAPEPQRAASVVSPATASDASGLRSKLARARTPKQRTTLIIQLLRGEAARVLRVAGVELRQDLTLVAQGMDSLGSQELRSSIATQLGLKVPASLLWNFPTLTALGEELERQLTSEQSLTGART